MKTPVSLAGRRTLAGSARPSEDFLQPLFQAGVRRRAGQPQIDADGRTARVHDDHAAVGTDTDLRLELHEPLRIERQFADRRGHRLRAAGAAGKRVAQASVKRSATVVLGDMQWRSGSAGWGMR